MKLFLLISAFFFSISAHASTVASIEFEGLTVTKESYLRKIIRLKEGETFSYDLMDNDVFLLRSLNLFFNVEGEAKEVEPDKFAVIYHIKEAKYLYPIFSISGFRSQLQLKAGANHINFLGRAQSFGVQYQYYDRHSFSVFHTARRHGNNKTGHELALSKYSTIEPLYFQSAPGSLDTVSFFNFDNYSVSAGAFYWLGQYLNIGLGGAYFFENYFQRDEAFDVFGMKRFNFHKHQLRSSVNFNKVESIYELRDGWIGNLYAEWIHTYTNNNTAPGFFKFTATGGYYKVLGERGNLAVRSRFGISTNNDSPFAPFVLDGFLNVRGIGNRVDRGTAELILNLEYRHTLWKHKWVTLQAAAFCDHGTLRSPGDTFNDFLPKSKYNLLTGGGLRLHLNVVYNTCIRVDYSVNPFDPTIGGFTFGFGQFF